MKVGHAIHPGYLLWVGFFGPHHFGLLRLQVNKCDTFIPLAFDAEANIFRFALDFESLALALERIITEPASPLESHLATLIRPVLINHEKRLAYVHVELADHEVVDAKCGRDYFVCLVELVEVDVGPILLVYFQHFSCKADIWLRVVKERILFASDINGGDRRMMRNLFSQKLKLISLHFKSFEQHWVKRLPNRFLSNCLRSHHISGHQSYPSHRVFFHRSQIQNLRILP